MKINKVIEKGNVYIVEAEVDGNLVRRMMPKALIKTKEDIVARLTPQPEKRVKSLEGEA
jgi:lactam utilization protein B